jgi:[ribosomal protein S18]-alanine N-acetyltransferase
LSGDKTIVDTRIRPAGLDELEALGDLDIEVFGRLAYPPFVLRQLFDMYREYWLVVEHPSGDGLAGYSLGAPTPDCAGAWLLGLAVAPDCRNLGLGVRLTVGSLQLLRSRGVPKVSLTVEPTNDVAIALYRRVGFAITAVHADYFGPGEDRAIMTCPLAQPSVIPVPRPGSRDL